MTEQESKATITALEMRFKEKHELVAECISMNSR
jgi:hypothetical protein